MKTIDEPDARVVAHEVGDPFGPGFEALCPHQLAEVGDGLRVVVDDDGGLVDQPDLPRPVGLCAGEQRDGVVDVGLLITEVEDIAVGPWLR